MIFQLFLTSTQLTGPLPANPKIPWSSATFGTTTKIDTELQFLNRLIFEFPSLDDGPTWVRTCPFFENPQVRESQQANIHC